MSRDNVGCHKLVEEGDMTGIKWVESRDAAELPMMDRGQLQAIKDY